MDAIKLEMNKNDQFEMIKYSPHFPPRLSDVSLDGLPVTFYTVFLQIKWMG